MRKKFLILAVILVSAFSANIAGTCTLDAAGKCKCQSETVNGEIVSYQCVEGSSDMKCVCPPPSES